MDRVNMDTQNNMETLDDQLRNVASRQYDTRRHEFALKAGPLFTAINSRVQGSHNEAGVHSGFSCSQGSNFPNDPLHGSTESPNLRDINAELRSRSIGAMMEGRRRRESADIARSHEVEVEAIASAQDSATASRGRSINARVGAAQRIASRERSADSEMSGSNATSYVVCGTSPSDGGCSAAGSSVK